MGRKLSGGGTTFPPTAELRKAGAMFKGKLIGVRMQDFGYGEKPVYKFAALDADCDFKSGGNLVEAPAEGAEVEIIAPTVLAKQLSTVKPGEIVTIKGLGEGEKKKGRNAPWLFDSEVE